MENMKTLWSTSAQARKHKKAFFHGDTGKLLGFSPYKAPQTMDPALLCSLPGAKVFSQEGKYLGYAHDFTWDSATDFLLNIHVQRRFLWWTWSRHIFPAERIWEMKAGLIVVSTDSMLKVATPAQVDLA